jgi:hypothetical protein
MTQTQITVWRQRCLSAGALLATIGLITGCGASASSDPAAQFKTRYESARIQFKQASHAIGAAIQQAPSQTDAQIRSTFRGLANRWQIPLSNLQTLNAPATVSTDFSTLTDAATRVETDLNTIASAAATRSVPAAQQAGASLVNDVTVARKADAKIVQRLGIT